MKALIKALGTALTTLIVGVALASTAHAEVPASQAARLGRDLTPMGSEKAGSGTVPAWTGGISGIPRGVNWKPASRKPHANPFPSDRPLYTITPGNMGKYRSQLTEGYKTMLKTYNTFSMPVYKSRRSCALPKFVYQANKRNAQVGRLVGGGNGVSEGIMGSPFPIPNNAIEIIWNHTLRYRSFKVTREFTASAPSVSGAWTGITVQDEAILQWSDPAIKRAESLDNISLYYIAHTTAPARSAGSVVLVHESLNRAIEPRKAWQYSPGTRRVRRAPNIAYDNPGTNSDALSTSDSFDGYNGAPDRYDWTVVGKTTKLISYNNYQTALAPLSDLLTPRHLNQKYSRYEPHRVWTIEANLKPTARHVYSRRIKHIDEDAWRIATSELYDSRGELWRVQELPYAQFYEVPLCGGSGEVVYDLQAGRYVALALRNNTDGLNYFADELDVRRYTPASIRRLGKR